MVLTELGYSIQHKYIPAGQLSKICYAQVVFHCIGGLFSLFDVRLCKGGRGLHDHMKFLGFIRPLIKLYVEEIKVLSRACYWYETYML